MKALSIRQPWAHAILFAGKRIENRTWSTPFRGEFLIHAAKGCTEIEMQSALYSIRECLQHPVARERVPGPLLVRGFVDAPRGGIVGRARLVDVLQPSETPTEPWHAPGQYGFVLVDVEPLPFRPLLGARRFFEVPR